jgi:hypothetical protein
MEVFEEEELEAELKAMKTDLGLEAAERQINAKLMELDLFSSPSALLPILPLLILPFLIVLKSYQQ